MFYSSGQFRGKSCLLVDSIYTLWYVFLVSRNQAVCCGGVPWSGEFYMWYGWLPVSSPMNVYVVLIVGARCSVVFFGHAPF